MLEQLLDSGVLYTEFVEGSESYRINKEAETKIRAAGLELAHMESKQQASCLQSAGDLMATPSPDKANNILSLEAPVRGAAAWMCCKGQ